MNTALRPARRIPRIGVPEILATGARAAQPRGEGRVVMVQGADARDFATPHNVKGAPVAARRRREKGPDHAPTEMPVAAVAWLRDRWSFRACTFGPRVRSAGLDMSRGQWP
jgi:hypothetical protein